MSELSAIYSCPNDCKGKKSGNELFQGSNLPTSPHTPPRPRFVRSSPYNLYLRGGAYASRTTASTDRDVSQQLEDDGLDVGVGNRRQLGAGVVAQLFGFQRVGERRRRRGPREDGVALAAAGVDPFSTRTPRRRSCVTASPARSIAISLSACVSVCLPVCLLYIMILLALYCVVVLCFTVICISLLQYLAIQP